MRIFTKFNETFIIDCSKSPRGVHKSPGLTQTIWNWELVMLIKRSLSEAIAATCLVTKYTQQPNSSMPMMFVTFFFFHLLILTSCALFPKLDTLKKELIRIIPVIFKSLGLEIRQSLLSTHITFYYNLFHKENKYFCARWKKKKKTTTANLVVIGILQYISANGNDRKQIAMTNSILLTKGIKVNKQNKCH